VKGLDDLRKIAKAVDLALSRTPGQGGGSRWRQDFLLQRRRQWSSGGSRCDAAGFQIGWGIAASMDCAEVRGNPSTAPTAPKATVTSGDGKRVEKDDWSQNPAHSIWPSATAERPIMTAGKVDDETEGG